MPKKISKKPTAVAPPEEHIFPATKLEPLALRWKDLNGQKRHTEASALLEEIIVGSTAMFERLAQYEDFHHTVDLPILVSAAQEKVVKWLLKWQPKKGRLFSWFSKCAKHAFLSELVKVNQYRKRYHVTGDSLERFYGADDHEVNKHDIAAEYRNRLQSLTCRWGDEQEIGAIRYIVECIVEDHKADKASVIRGAAYANGISFDMAKFFYAWALVGLRHVFFDKAYLPFTESDLLRASESYTLWPDLVDTIGLAKSNELIAKFGGQRLRIPSLEHVKKLRDDYRLHQALIQSDLDPDTFSGTAKKHGRTQKSAHEVYAEMSKTLDPRRCGEYEVYGHSNGGHAD